jgi:hypothetical protein
LRSVVYIYRCHQQRTTEPAGEYTFFYGRKNEIHELGTGFFVHKKISAVKRIEFVSDRMSHIILRGCWCHIVLNVHAPSGNKIYDVKERFFEDLEFVFDYFPRYHMNILLGDFNAKVGRKEIFKPNCLNSGSHLLMYQFMRKMIKLTVVIIVG